MTKTYAIDGIVECSLLIKVNDDCRLRANFAGGVLDPKRNRPATLTTSNPVVMLILESSPEYNAYKIYVQNQSEDAVEIVSEGNRAEMAKPEKKAERKKIATPEVDESGKNIYKGITKFPEAVNLLLELGVGASELTDIHSALQAAADRNISFPNLKLK